MTNHNINSKTKRHIREIKGNRCERCGKLNGLIYVSEERLQIHHKKPKSDGGTNRLSNLKLVCKDCHDEEHRKLYKKKLIRIQTVYKELMQSGQY